MLVKRIAAYIPIYLQPFPSNPSLIVQTFAILAHFLHILASPGYALGTIVMNVTRLERGVNSCKMPRCIPIYLQPFLRYCKLLVENCDIFIPHLCLVPPQG